MIGGPDADRSPFVRPSVPSAHPSLAMPRSSAAAAGASTAAAAASARLHKQRHSENESARRARLKDKFLALAALLGQQEAHHSDHDSDTPTATTAAAAAANGKSAGAKSGGGGGGGESGSRLQTLAMAIEKLHANKETIDKLEARCSSLQAQLAAATRNNAAAAASSHAAAPAAPSSILLQQQHLQQQVMRQQEIDRLMASNASLQAQLMASNGGGNGGVIGGSGPGLSPHLDSDYLMSLVGQQQQQRHVPGQQQQQQQHVSMAGTSSVASHPHTIKRSGSAARLGVMGMGGMSLVPDQLYAHQPSSSAPPVSAAAAERGLAQISLDRGLSSRTDMSQHSAHSHASSAASASSFLAATSAMSINMPHKRRRTTESDGGMSSGSASPPTSSLSTLVAASAGLGVAPLSSYPLLNAQPCVLLTPSAEVIDCTSSFVRLLSDGNDGGDEVARKQSLLSHSLFTLLAPSELKSTLALIKRLWTTGAQAQAAELARAGVNDTVQSNEADTLMGIEDAVKNFLPLDSRPSSMRGAAAPVARVLSVRLVLLAVMDRVSHSPHVLLGLALPVQPEGSGAPKSFVPAGFPHGVKACLAEMARECGELLGDEQQRYLVAALYGTPKSRLDPASAAAASNSAAAAAGSGLRTSMSHHNLHSMASAAVSVAAGSAAAMDALHPRLQQPYSAHSRTASSQTHYRHPSGSGLDASLGLTPTLLQRSRTESPPPQPSHYDQLSQEEAQSLVPLQLRSPLVEAVPTPADHAPLDEEAEPELPAFAAPSPLLLHRNVVRAARSSSDASVFRSPVDAAPALLPDDDAIDLDAQPPAADGEGDVDAEVAVGGGGDGGDGGDDDDAHVFAGRQLGDGGDEEDGDGHALPFTSPLLLHTLSGQSLPLSPLPVRGNSVHKQMAAGARAALIGQDQDDEMEDVMD